MTDRDLDRFPDGALFVMQGRLSAPEQGRFQSFPRDGWRQEIDRVHEVGLMGIEWIFDTYGIGANPIESSSERTSLKRLFDSKRVSVRSVCADYFMDFLLVDEDGVASDSQLNKLIWLVDACDDLGVGRVVLPFVDSSSIRTTSQRDGVLRLLTDALPVARARSVELHIESDMGPRVFRDFLRDLPGDVFKVNYDAGNSAALGYKPYDEFSNYGDRIGSFHIKDRLRGGGTVPLGTGDADFQSLRAALKEFRYAGDFVLQAARGLVGNEVEWIRTCAIASTLWLRGEVSAPKLPENFT